MVGQRCAKGRGEQAQPGKKTGAMCSRKVEAVSWLTFLRHGIELGFYFKYNEMSLKGRGGSM